MKDIEVSLYELFGYVAPGALSFAGLYLIAWGLVLSPDQNWTPLTSGGWIVLLMLSYLLGHGVQAILNVASHRVPFLAEATLIGRIEVTRPQVMEAARNKAHVVLGIPSDTPLDVAIVCEVADHFLQQKGKTETRDVYIYREGFYRGLAVALVVLAVGAILRTLNAPGELAAFGVSIPVDRPSLLTVAVLAIVMAALSTMRFLRFATYRIKNSLYGFVMIPQNEEKDKPTQQEAHLGGEVNGKA